MLKIVIVEDDLTIRRGLIECVPWEDYGIEVVGEATNGKTALEFIVDNPVDIVLTDVVMPKMDGIELVRQIREKGLEIKVVFVSGHSDLPYLKQAFRLDVMDYILKPVKHEELAQVLRKISGICMEEKTQKDKLNELKKRLEESMPVLKERFIALLVKGSIYDLDYIKARMQFLGLPFSCDDKFTVMSLDIAFFHGQKSIHAQEERELELISVLENIMKVESNQYGRFFLVEDDKTMIIILSSKEHFGYDEVIAFAGRIQQELHAHTGSLPPIGIGRDASGAGELHYSYEQSKKALEQKYFLGQDAIIHINDLEKSSVKEEIDLSGQKVRIIESVRLGRRKDTERFVDCLFDIILRTGTISMRYTQNICIELVVLAEKEILDMRILNSRNRHFQKEHGWVELLELKSISETHLWLKEYLSEMADTVMVVKDNTSGNLGRMMVNHVQERFSEDITIHALANEFYITSNYVCILFKKATGKTFNEYLTEVRMEKAKELLKNPLLKVYEIAEMVGYSDADYFGKLFKRCTGMTISQFKKS